MSRPPYPGRIPKVVLGLLFGAACASAAAGESSQVNIPTAPTLYYVCMSGTGTTPSNTIEYDSAVFAMKNPGSDLKSHSEQAQRINAAFDAYLQQKHGLRGLANCGSHESLAAAKDWLQGRKNRSVEMGYKYVATGWVFDAGAAASADSGEGAALGAAAPAAPPAAPGVRTVFWSCTVVHDRTEYDSAIFEAPNDTGTSRLVQLSYAAFLSEKYRTAGGARCVSKPTRAEAVAALQSYASHVAAGVTRRVATGWVYDAGGKPAAP